MVAYDIAAPFPEFATMHGCRVRLALPLVLAALGACAGTPKPTADAALDAYRAGRWEEAYEQARASLAAGGGNAEAEYVAGLACLQLDRPSTAQPHLERAARSDDDAVAPRAKAALGLALLELDRPAEAAALLGEAAGALPEPDASQAARRAADAFRRAGDPALADRWARLGQAAPPPAGRYTLQIGAWEDRRGAERAAAQHGAAVRGAGVGPVRIVEIRDALGRTLHAARFGNFPTSEEAEAVRRRNGWMSFYIRTTE